MTKQNREFERRLFLLILASWNNGRDCDNDQPISPNLYIKVSAQLIVSNGRMGFKIMFKRLDIWSFRENSLNPTTNLCLMIFLIAI